MARSVHRLLDGCLRSRPVCNSHKRVLLGMAAVTGSVLASHYTCNQPALLESLRASSFKVFDGDSALKRHTWRYDAGKFHFPERKEEGTIVLVACGSYSPPTSFHLRMLEDARDGLEAQGYTVAGGFLSPTHIKYGKKSLVANYHRANMLGLALQDSDWLQVHLWESMQDEWSETVTVLKKIKEDVSKMHAGARLMMLCGSDLLETFPVVKGDGTPLWSPEHQQFILGDLGVVVMEREGTDLQKVISQHAILRENKENIITFKPAAKNDISSTLVRKALQEGRSIKYLVHEEVRRYIYENDLQAAPAWK
eukprot:TRINITY_DN53892_c0_g1_i1.p1 TRINITY_DN53892_c0_g1~~TRINITY_DN53892_c0_g1_i1.p1  ORF type:complete len:324 (-),score=64.93 TRINITY_DN53892_c0_g1_i1:56-982(-)